MTRPIGNFVSLLEEGIPFPSSLITCFELATRSTWTISPRLLMKYELLEGSTH